MPKAVTIKVLGFGIVREIIGGDFIHLELPEPANVAQLRDSLSAHFPALADLAQCAVAVDQAYATDDIPVTADSEVALIPPVCGG